MNVPDGEADDDGAKENGLSNALAETHLNGEEEEEEVSEEEEEEKRWGDVIII